MHATHGLSTMSQSNHGDHANGKLVFRTPFDEQWLHNNDTDRSEQQPRPPCHFLHGEPLDFEDEDLLSESLRENISDGWE